MWLERSNMAAAQTSGPSRTRDLRNTSGACASDTAAETGVTAYERCRWTGNSRHFIKDLFSRTVRLGLSRSTVIASEEPPAGVKEIKGTSFWKGLWVFTPWTGADNRFGWSREFHFGGVCIPACSSRGTESWPTSSKGEVSNPPLKTGAFIKPVWRGCWENTEWRA